MTSRSVGAVVLNNLGLAATKEHIMTRFSPALLAALSTSVYLSAPAAAQTAQLVPPSTIAAEARDTRELIVLIGLQPEYVVSGDQRVDTAFLAANVIRFKPSSRLIFSDRARAMRNNLIVAAHTIVNEDPTKPGTITWLRGQGPSQSPPASGQAPSGSHGVNDGQPGGPGTNGAQGNSGAVGQTAPNITLFLLSANGAPPIIDMRGQNGGIGGSGQRGGDGGVGHQGSPASSSLIDCRSGAGYGGNGGAGGNGGLGGRGGQGGTGGTVTLVSLPSAFPHLLQFVRVVTSGGDGGDGGAGGTAGSGGPGGAQGAKSLPYCKDEPGRRGADGPTGQPGSTGERGASGTQGDLFYTTLELASFNALFNDLPGTPAKP